MRLSIGAKLALAFLIILLFGGWMGWRVYEMYTSVQARYTLLLRETYPLAVAAQQLNVEVQTQAQMLMAYAVNREEGAKSAVGEARVRAQDRIDFLQSGAEDYVGLSERVVAIVEKQTLFNNMVSAIFKSGDDVNALELQQDAERARSLAQSMSQDVEVLVLALQGLVESRRTEATAEAATALRELATVAGVAFGVSILVVILAQIFIARPVRRVALELRAISGGAGDLSRRLSIRTGDELQDLADSFNQMQSHLADMVRQVVSAAEKIGKRSNQAQVETRSVSQAAVHVRAAMSQVASGAQHQTFSATTASETMQQLMEAIGQIAAGAQQQAIQVQGTTLTVGNMVCAMEGVARHTGQVSDAASLAAETARRGADIVDKTLAGMERIRMKVLQAASRMENLDQHTRRIGEIMQVITDIADQTNLLALNAAIEAARAGEQGRGFAVVADEVRKLAERAAHSAKEIRTLIKNIQSGMSEAVAATREGVGDVESGAELAAAAGAALQEIRTTVERTTTGIQSISSAAREVLSATREVARSVEEVAAVTEENSAATEEMAAGANQVNETMSDVQLVSESNSRAVEDVAGSLQAVNTSMDDMARLADELASIASNLQQLVGQFRIEEV